MTETGFWRLMKSKTGFFYTRADAVEKILLYKFASLLSNKKTIHV